MHGFEIAQLNSTDFGGCSSFEEGSALSASSEC